MREMLPDRNRPADSGLALHSAALVQRKCSCGGKGGDCEECKAKATLSRRTRTTDAGSSAVPSIVHDVLRSPGQNLDSQTRESMESHFGHDFGQVRVHADTHAARSAEAVNALAYTFGAQVVFADGQYRPHSAGG